MTLQHTDARSFGGYVIRQGGDAPKIPPLYTEHDRLRHQATIAALSRRSYRHAFEPGCGGGGLTARLAGMCDRVSALDISPNAVARTRARCAHWNNVDVRCADLRGNVPEAPLDLIVLSDIGYYFTAPELIRIVRRLAAQMIEGGEFLAVHGLNPPLGHALQADAVHCQLLANLPLEWLKSERDAGLRIDAWRLAR